MSKKWAVKFLLAALSSWPSHFTEINQRWSHDHYKHSGWVTWSLLVRHCDWRNKASQDFKISCLGNPLSRGITEWVTDLLSASLSISIMSAALMLRTCCLAHLCVCMSVCLESVLWQNGWTDLDAVWGGEWDRLKDGCIRWWSSKGKGQFWGRIWGVPLWPMGPLQCTLLKLLWGLVKILGRPHTILLLTYSV